MRDAAEHILVVDDEASIREALATALKSLYLVHTAATGCEACRVLCRHPIAAIVLDMVLGDEHGLDLIERFRALSRARIVILTGHSTEDLAIRAVGVADGYLKKPPSIPDLYAALRRVLPPQPAPADLAGRARRILDAYPSKQLRLANLAHQLGVSRRHLRRIFQRASGKTPQRYLTELRIQHAADLLDCTALGVKEVAQAVGWSNIAHFYKMFKQIAGSTPAEYRARRGHLSMQEAADRGPERNA